MLTRTLFLSLSLSLCLKHCPTSAFLTASLLWWPLFLEGHASCFRSARARGFGLFGLKLGGGWARIFLMSVIRILVRLGGQMLLNSKGFCSADRRCSSAMSLLPKCQSSPNLLLFLLVLSMKQWKTSCFPDLSCLLSAKYCCGIIDVLILLCHKAPRDHWTVYMFALPHFFGQESSVFGKSETVGTRGN